MRGHRFRKLRALAAKMDVQLAEKSQIIDKQAEQFARQSEQIEEWNERIEKLNIRLENMIQALLHARKKLFGPSTEYTKQVDGPLIMDKIENLVEGGDEPPT